LTALFKNVRACLYDFHNLILDPTLAEREASATREDLSLTSVGGCGTRAEQHLHLQQQKYRSYLCKFIFISLVPSNVFATTTSNREDCTRLRTRAAHDLYAIMQQPHLFSHQNPYHHQASADWQHHAVQQQPQSHHSYAQSQAVAAAHQQHYGRLGVGTGQSGNGSSTAAMNAGTGLGNNGGGGGGGRENGLDHSVGPNNMFGGPGEQSSEDNRRVLEWIAQVLNANTRESALLELSKKREQVPELALILWHSFGICDLCLGACTAIC